MFEQAAVLDIQFTVSSIKSWARYINDHWITSILTIIVHAIESYKSDVTSGKFPGAEHSFSIDKTELDRLKKEIGWKASFARYSWLWRYRACRKKNYFSILNRFYLFRNLGGKFMFKPETSFGRNSSHQFEHVAIQWNYVAIGRHVRILA